jgi:hypothetical protein
MKLFEVSIDRDPGGWKSGNDPHVLVIANSKEEAIKKVREGWDYKFEHTEDGVVLTYMKMKKEFPIRAEYNISASEIKFDGYDLHAKSIRKAKLDRIEKHITRNEK